MKNEHTEESERSCLPADVRRDGIFLLAFFDTMEMKRRAGEILGYSAHTNSDVRNANGAIPFRCVLGVCFRSGPVFAGGDTWEAAKNELVRQLIHHGTGGVSV